MSTGNGQDRTMRPEPFDSSARRLSKGATQGLRPAQPAAPAAMDSPPHQRRRSARNTARLRAEAAAGCGDRRGQSRNR